MKRHERILDSQKKYRERTRYTRRILERVSKRRDENIGDVETPVAKQFFDRISARTCSVSVSSLSFFAHRASQMDRNLSFQRCVARRGCCIGNFPAMQPSCKMV